MGPPGKSEIMGPPGNRLWGHTVYTHRHTIYTHSIHTHRKHIHTLKRYWRGGAAIILGFLDQKYVGKGHFRDRCKKNTDFYILSLVFTKAGNPDGNPTMLG